MRAPAHQPQNSVQKFRSRRLSIGRSSRHWMEKIRLLSLGLVALLVCVDATYAAEESSLIKRQGYLAGTTDYKAELTPAQQKLSTDLLQLADHRFLPAGLGIERAAQNMQSLKQLCPNNAESKLDQMISEGSVYVYIHFNQDSDESILEPFNVNITDSDMTYKLAVAWVQVKELESIAALDGVRTIRTVLPPITRKGSALTEGDSVLRSSDVRSIFSQQGSGIKVGIISDGVDNRAEAQASGDLPADGAGLTVLRNDVEPDIPEDEGTAMLEIVHDMIPDANLFFYERGINKLTFNQAIDELVSAGCNVICDDIGFGSEPFFEDGVVASHVRSIIENNDIIYVSAVGNDGLDHYQGIFNSQGGVNSNYHDFSHGTSADYKNLYVNIPAGSKMVIVLQWNDPFGGSANDYDLYLYSRSTKDVVQKSVYPQNGDDDPIEALVYTADELTAGVFEIRVERYGNASPKILEVFIYPNFPAKSYGDNLTSVDSIYGHPAVPGVVAVGAIGVNDPNDPEHSSIEPFSSQGPVTISYPAEDIRQKPDICGVDRVSVTGAGGFASTFFGTSAAAPHIAAIMAQLWAAMPDYTGDEIRDMVLADAVDLGEMGIDNVFGFGRADALAAFYSNYFCVDTFPYIEDFEHEGNLPLGWRNSIFDDTNWIPLPQATPSGSTGPSSAFSGDYYLYIESTGNGTGYPEKTAILESPYFDIKPYLDMGVRLSFEYHMYGALMGNLIVELSEDSGSSWTQIWSKSGNQGNTWHEATVDISSYNGKIVKLRFRGITGTGYTSDMAIDDISIKELIR